MTQDLTDKEIDAFIEKFKPLVKWEYVDKWGSVNECFEEEYALAIFLMLDIVFTNTYWWEKSWDEKARSITGLFVNCNDVFMWACAESEDLLFSEIKDLYEHFLLDRNTGSVVWCIKKRKMMPQKPFYDEIQKKGIWNLDEMGLAPNPTWK